MGLHCGDVVLVTGASSGIGRATAELLAQNGFKVYGTSRNPEAAKREDRLFEMIKLDVCHEDSVREAVDYVIYRAGRLDILINNAGYGLAGAVEDTSMGEVYRQLDTNFFGVLRMCRHAIPIMRKQGNGLIINISSVAGQISIPFQSMYSASKYALEAVTEAMRIEVKPFGIKAVLVEPGDTKTGFKRVLAKESVLDSPYKERFERSIKAMEQSEASGPSPEKVAKTILKLTGMKNPPVRVTLGLSYKAAVLFKRLLPASMVEYIVSRLYSG